MMRDTTYALTPVMAPEETLTSSARASAWGTRTTAEDVSASAREGATDKSTVLSDARERRGTSMTTNERDANDETFVFDGADAVRAPTALDARDIQFFLDAKKLAAKRKDVAHGAEVKVVKIESSIVRQRR